MAVTTKNADFWDVTSCGSSKNRRFGGAYHSVSRLERISEMGTKLALTGSK
jgi:hypothetical protein